MIPEKPTIIALIVNHAADYLGEDGWTKDIREACLYTPSEARAKLRALYDGRPEGNVVYAIQDRSFNFYDGDKFVYSLRDARLYTEEDARQEFAKLLQ